MSAAGPACRRTARHATIRRSACLRGSVAHAGAAGQLPRRRAHSSTSAASKSSTALARGDCAAGVAAPPPPVGGKSPTPRPPRGHPGTRDPPLTGSDLLPRGAQSAVAESPFDEVPHGDVGARTCWRDCSPVGAAGEMARYPTGSRRTGWGSPDSSTGHVHPVRARAGRAVRTGSRFAAVCSGSPVGDRRCPKGEARRRPHGASGCANRAHDGEGGRRKPAPRAARRQARRGAGGAKPPAPGRS
jgi:hypothetical protein